MFWIAGSPMRIAIIAAFTIAFCSSAGWADDSAAIRKSAKSGDAEAQLALGRHYADEARNARNERGARRDWRQAHEWYSKSAEQGFAQAQYELGGMYILGEGVEKDEDLGVDWLIKAADQGLAAAQFEVGNLYLAGARLEQDSELGLDMLIMAADQRHVPAQKQLGTIYFQGVGVEKDLVQAHLWFSIASLNDDKASQGYLLTLESIMNDEQIDEARALAAQWQIDHVAE
jgi:TPR repeat protein